MAKSAASWPDNLSFPKKIIAYRPDALAPHQGMLVDFLKAEIGDQTCIVVRTIPTGTLARLGLIFRVAWDALLNRGAVLYFGSFLSVIYAAVPILMLHRKWIYHSQDWITDGSGLAAKLEPWVVKSAPVVLWNEPNRAAKAREEAGRANGIFVLPTYLPSDYPVPMPARSIRDDIAKRAGVSADEMVIVFAGGGYSKARLSDQFVKATRGLDDNAVFVFTGATRVPAALTHSKIIDLGMLDYDDMIETMASSDIGMLLYDYRGSFGNRHQQPGRLTEYAKGGLAMIATPFGDSDRLARETKFCLVVEGYSVPELHDALSTMIDRIRSGAAQRSEISQFAARDMAYENFARPIMGKVFGQLC